MPTGYTADVASGKITDFTEYALQCARNFGACIMLRDEPLSSEIPEFAASDFNARAIKEAERDLSEFLAMDETARRKLYDEEHAAKVAQAKKALNEKAIERRRYEAMLAKAREYKSPSSDHDNYAAFLVSQLEESIKFDCGTSYWDGEMQRVPFVEWQTCKRDGLQRDIAYHEKSNQEEIDRTNARNEWVRKLKESLAAVPA